MTPAKSPKAPFTYRDIPFHASATARMPAPPVADVFARDPKLRRNARKYWIMDTLQGGVSIASHQAIRLLPSAWASAFGDRMSGLAHRLNAKRPFARRIGHNIAVLKPEIAGDKPARRKLESRWWQNTGRLYAEYCVADRLWRENRIEIVGREHFDAANAAGRKTFLAMVHLGTWEAMLAALHSGMNLPFVATYQPQPNRFINGLVYRLRRRSGVKLLPPGLKTAMWLRKLAECDDGIVGMFVDEERANQSHFPLFGRPVPKTGNIVNIVKLALAGDAAIAPCYITRLAGANFRLTICPPIKPSEATTETEVISSTILRLNDIFEPLVLEHINQWFMLSELRLPTAMKAYRPASPRVDPCD